MICLFACLIVGTGLLSTEQAAEAQDEKYDKFFPVTVDPTRLPPAGIMRIGEVSERTGFMGIYAIRFSDDGKKLAIRARDQVVHVFDLNSGKRLFELDGHEGYVRGLEFSPDGKHVATLGATENESVVLWELETGKEVKRFSFGGEDMVFTKDGKYIHVMRDNRLDRIRVEDGSVKRLLTWPRQERCVGLSRDGSTVATVTQKGQLRSSVNPIYLNSYVDGRVNRFGIDVGLSQAKQIEFSPNRDWLLARFEYKRQVYFWEGARPKQKTELGAHETEIISISSSHDNRFFITTAKSGGAFLWDAISKEPIAKLDGHDEKSNIVAGEFSPDGNWFATGASGIRDSSMVVWDLKKMVLPGLEREPAELKDDQLESIWKQLSDSKGKVALEAVKDVVLHGDQTVNHFHDRIMKTTNIVDQTRITEFISNLDSPKFSVRNDAMESLLKLRNVAEVKLREALAKATSVEARYRIDKILKTPIEKPKIDAADYRRLQRMIYALELTANSKSLELLDNLSKGHPHIDIAREASESLTRAKSLANRTN